MMSEQKGGALQAGSGGRYEHAARQRELSGSAAGCVAHGFRGMWWTAPTTGRADGRDLMLLFYTIWPGREEKLNTSSVSLREHGPQTAQYWAGQNPELSTVSPSASAVSLLWALRSQRYLRVKSSKSFHTQEVHRRALVSHQPLWSKPFQFPVSTSYAAVWCEV